MTKPTKWVCAHSFCSFCHAAAEVLLLWHVQLYGSGRIIPLVKTITWSREITRKRDFIKVSSLSMTKQTKWPVQSDQTSLSAWRSLRSLAVLWAHSEESGWYEVAGRTGYIVDLSCSGSIICSHSPGFCETEMFAMILRLARELTALSTRKNKR